MKNITKKFATEQNRLQRGVKWDRWGVEWDWAKIFNNLFLKNIKKGVFIN